MPTESVELVVVPELESAKKLALITPESALSVKEAYLPLFTAFLALEKEAADIAVNAPKAAHEMQMSLRKIRTSADKSRKSLGEEAKRYKDAVDEVYNILEARLVPIEERMKSIAKAEEIAAKERALKLRDKRLAELAPFGQDNSFYDLANLPETQFQQLMSSQKTAHEAKQAALKKEADDRAAAEEARLKREADLKADRDRLAKEAADRQAALDKLAAETKRLKAEADAKLAAQAKAAADQAARLKKEADAKLAAQAKAAADEAAKIKKANDDRLAKEAADRAAQEKVAQAKRDAEEKAAQAERDRVKAAQDLQAKLEREALETQAKTAQQAAQLLLDAENARKEREAQAKAKADEATKQAARAPDTEKVLAFARAIEAVQVPTLSTNVDLPKRIADQSAKYVKWLRAEAGKL